MNMFNRWSALFLFAGTVLGYAVAGSSVAAQPQSQPFAVGDHVTLRYENDRSFTCVIGELQGIYVRCDSSRVSTSIGRGPTPEHWLSLRSVLSVEKHRAGGF